MKSVIKAFFKTLRIVLGPFMLLGDFLPGQKVCYALLSNKQQLISNAAAWCCINTKPAPSASRFVRKCGG